MVIYKKALMSDSVKARPRETHVRVSENKFTQRRVQSVPIHTRPRGENKIRR